jgi:hypothetical protein
LVTLSPTKSSFNTWATWSNSTTPQGYTLHQRLPRLPTSPTHHAVDEGSHDPVQKDTNHTYYRGSTASARFPHTFGTAYGTYTRSGDCMCAGLGRRGMEMQREIRPLSTVNGRWRQQRTTTGLVPSSIEARTAGLIVWCSESRNVPNQRYFACA